MGEFNKPGDKVFMWVLYACIFWIGPRLTIAVLTALLGLGVWQVIKWIW